MNEREPATAGSAPARRREFEIDLEPVLATIIFLVFFGFIIYAIWDYDAHADDRQRERDQINQTRIDNCVNAGGSIQIEPVKGALLSCILPPP